MEKTIIEDVSEILETFNLEEIKDLLKKQVDLTENIGTNMTDYFMPLYFSYKSIIEAEENSQEMKYEATTRFNEVCNLFIDAICEKFHLEINDEWRMLHEMDLPGLVTAMYCFFIKDIVSNIQEVCINYIQKNRKEIFTVFEDRKKKKDASTLVEKRKHPIDMAVIIANIYDVSSWILSQLSEEQYIEYMNDQYVPLRVLYPMFQNGDISGDFLETINEAYSQNLELKAETCYQILSVINK